MLAKTKVKVKILAFRITALGPAFWTLAQKLFDVAMHFFGGPCVGH